MNGIGWAKDVASLKQTPIKRNLFDDTFKAATVDLIKSVLTQDEFKYLLSKSNSQYAFSNLLKRVCNIRCVQKRKPFKVDNI